MDFYSICAREIETGPNKGVIEIYPDFRVGRSQDLMVRAKSFYAIWDEEQGIWSTDEYDVQRLVDADLRAYTKKLQETTGLTYKTKYLVSYSSKMWKEFRNFLQNVSDNSHDMDDNLTFQNTEVKKSDYASKRLPYALAEGDCSAWDELVGTLYSVEERAKIEWAIGSIIAGDAKRIQKFIVLYGAPGTGKGTIITILEKLFPGYYTTFDAKALGSSAQAFATEAFKNNPLVAIQHDGDLSRIEDNARLNSIISHENMPMNEKYKPGYTSWVKAMLFLGTNKPVKISDAKSGIIRRLIDVHPTGVKIPENHYSVLMSRVDHELGAIAQHCLNVYRSMGKNAYSSYRPLEMMLQTDRFFNFIEAHYDVFKQQNSTSLAQAYALYKEYCNENGDERPLPRYQFRSELRNYFDTFKERGEINGAQVRSFYEGFNANKFKEPQKDAPAFSLVLEDTESLFDVEYADMPAQYGNSHENPLQYWSDAKKLINGKLQTPRPDQIVSTVLADIDTTKLHFVKIPREMFVVDFDLKDPETGEKSLEMNLQAASNWPPTYAELSKGGNGVHLHYFVADGVDVEQLATHYSEGIEIKTLLGDSSLRRRLTKCNNIPVAVYHGKLPQKEKKVLTAEKVQSEKGLRAMIARCLRKENHGHTKPEIDFIAHILHEAHEDGLQYDVTDLRSTIVAFANNSSHQPQQALRTVLNMKFKGKDVAEKPLEEDPNLGSGRPTTETRMVSPDGKVLVTMPRDDREVFYDLEVYPNLFVICWKFAGADTVQRMINPSAADVEQLITLKLVGFNNRRYDNHILYGALMGYSVEQIYALSQRIINNQPGALFGEAYNLSYTDIYDYSSKKQSLKKFQIEYGIPHKEMDLPWDQPVPEELWPKVVEYCVNDVLSTEVTHEKRKADFTARQILAELSGLTPNDSTAKHTARIIFGNDRRPQEKFVYTDLRQEFPGYEFDEKKRTDKSTYMGEVVGEGGLVRAKPGMYNNVAVLDVASMHPTSIGVLNLFGPYTQNYMDLLHARLAIKHKRYDDARQMLNGRLAPYLKDEDDADALAYALKIVINIVYGLTSATFDNPFRDPRNKDNIVAKRGALFMMELRKFVEDQGFSAIHIKTDSIKIPDATPEIIEDVMKFGEKYGYTFEHEATYDKFCLVNDAVYIARKGDKWDAVGAQFQHPYVYKSLFTREAIEFDDLCETKQVSKGALYLDFEHDKPPADASIDGMQFIGRIGRFVPVEEGSIGARLFRVVDGKPYAATGTSGFLWIEDVMAKELGDQVNVDMRYFEGLAEKAMQAIEQYGPFKEFIA